MLSIKTKPEALCARAFELADTGRFFSWYQIANELEAEGYADAVRRLFADRSLVDTVNSRCRIATQET